MQDMNLTRAELGARALQDHAGLRQREVLSFGLDSEQVAELMDNPEYADVEFLVGRNGTPVYASKFFLVTRSSIFKALLYDNFREGPAYMSSASVLCSTPRTAEEISLSASLPPGYFRHRMEIRDVEPRTMRHLLYWCYTAKLHPDFVVPEAGDFTSHSQTVREHDLVHLYAAADRYLLDPCKELVESKLALMLRKNDLNALSIFDLACTFVPRLASLAQSYIATDAARFLGGRREETEARWLAMSPAAAARLVEANLEDFEEVDLFRAIVRRY